MEPNNMDCDTPEALRFLASAAKQAEAEWMRKAADEIERLRTAIRRLADQDATLSVCNGSVTVTMDTTLTDEEREAIETCILGLVHPDDSNAQNVLRRLLGRFRQGTTNSDALSR